MFVRSCALFLLLVCFSTFSKVNCYIITIDAHGKECFFEKVEFGAKLGLTFEIADGGFRDIDVKITGPDGKLMYGGERESSGKYTFAITTPGVYTYCFSNERSTMTPKVIMFNTEVSEARKPSEEKGAGEGEDPSDPTNHGKLDDMIKELSTSLWSVKNEQEYMQVRDRNHRAINENTNSRVVMWSFFEAAVLVCMTVGQVFYLKRFFEVRRVV